jgi:dolichol-phosphate mannosyltransferase
VKQARHILKRVNGPESLYMPASDWLKTCVAVVISAKNEAPSIGDIIDRTWPHCDDLIVVDGHSTDGTAEIALAHGARVVTDNGKGKGDAIRVGIAAVGCEVIVFMDGDGSHDPADIPRLVAPIKQGKADLVIGSRGMGGSDELHGDVEKLLRMVGSDLILIGINLRWKQNLTDSQNGFRAIRADVARSLGLSENITTIEQEMTMKCLREGCRVLEVPTHEYARRYGRSVIKLRKVWFRYIYSFFKYLLPPLRPRRQAAGVPSLRPVPEAASGGGNEVIGAKTS